MSRMRPFWFGFTGSVVGFVVMSGLAFWYYQDVFTVDRSGTIDFRITTGGNIGIGMQAPGDSPGSRLAPLEVFWPHGRHLAGGGLHPI